MESASSSYETPSRAAPSPSEVIPLSSSDINTPPEICAINSNTNTNVSILEGNEGSHAEEEYSVDVPSQPLEAGDVESVDRAIDPHRAGDVEEEEEGEQEEEEYYQGAEERARTRGQTRRRRELCLTLPVLVAILLAISVPIALSSSARSNSEETKGTISWEIVFEELVGIATDSGHSCAIRETDRSVFCWGNQVGVPANLFAATQVAAGDGFSCAIQESTHALLCWGDDSYADFAQPPSDLGEVSFVTASSGTICAVERNSTSTDASRCWGLHDYGRVEFSIPQSHGPLLAIAAPKGGSLQYLCGILEADNTVQCWSTSLNFDIQDEKLVEINENQKIEIPARSLAVMRDFVCFVSILDSSLQCLAFDDTTYDVNLLAIPSDTTYVQVVPGVDNRFCAILTSGTPICFGNNGQQIFTPSQVGEVQQISMDRDHVCAIDKRLDYGICWGTDAPPGLLAPLENKNTYGKVVGAGDGRTCAIGIYADTVDCWGSKRYQLLVGASDVSLGEELTCVVDSFDDKAKCVFGDGTFVLDRTVRQIEVSPRDLICTVGKFDYSVQCYRATCQRAIFQNYLSCFAISNFMENPENDMGLMVQDLKLSHHHYCLIRKYTNTLECGMLDDRMATNGTVPEAQVPSDILSVKDVALGRFFTCAVQENFEIVCWGDETKHGSEYVLNPPRGNYYQAIAATDYEVCAITLDNFVHCFGRPFISSMYVPSDVRFVDEIVAGSGHFCATLENQQVICWGSNRYGELSRDYFE